MFSSSDKDNKRTTSALTIRRSCHKLRSIRRIVESRCYEITAAEFLDIVIVNFTHLQCFRQTDREKQLAKAIRKEQKALAKYALIKESDESNTFDPVLLRQQR